MDTAVDSWVKVEEAPSPGSGGPFGPPLRRVRHFGVRDWIGLPMTSGVLKPMALLL